MKKIVVFSLLSFIVLLSSCNNQTIVAYNDTIVSAHEKLLTINKDFSLQFESFIDKPKSKAEFLKLITETNAKIADAKKPVDELTPFDDEGMRQKMLEMFDAYDHTMSVFKAKAADVIDPSKKGESIMLLLSEFNKLKVLNDEIQEIQVRYANNNNTQLR